VVVDYHVVDLAPSCEVGTAAFAEDPSIQFSTELPANGAAVDIVYANNALQYVEDYRTLVRRLCAYRARDILLVRNFAGSVPTFATAQMNHPGSVVATWWLNARELIDLVCAEGYALAYQSGTLWPYDTTNFPQSHRLTGFCHFLFVREG
jgi:putative methyltransferase (TIGR04325 family)